MLTDRLRWLTAGVLVCCATAAHAHRPHVHGEAELNVGVEGNDLFVELVAPAESLLGFERAPRDATEQAQLQTVRETLAAGAALFRGSSGCEPAAVAWEDPFGPDAAGPADGHADFVLRVSYSCTEHARSLEVGVFDAFPGVERIRAQFVTERSQGAATLRRDRTSLEW